MAYLLMKKFLTQFPGPYDVRHNSDGVDETFEIYCVTSDRFLAATYFWDCEQERFREAMAIATALNMVFHPEFVFEDGLTHLRRLVSEHEGGYTISRDHCDCRGGFWLVSSRLTGAEILQCYGAVTDALCLATASTVRKALAHAQIYLPRERQIQSLDEAELIHF